MACLAGFGKRISFAFLTLVLVVHSVGGIIAFSKDIKQQFSAGEATSSYLMGKKLSHLQIIGQPDFVVSTISGFLNKPIYYMTRQEYGSFIVYDENRKMEVKNRDLIEAVQTVSQEAQDSFLMVIGQEPLMDPKADTVLKEGWFFRDLTYKLIKSFDDEIVVADEVYYIYLMEKKEYDPGR